MAVAVGIGDLVTYKPLPEVRAVVVSFVRQRFDAEMVEITLLEGTIGPHGKGDTFPVSVFQLEVVSAHD